MKARRANRKGVVQVSETTPVPDESLGHIEGDISPAEAVDEFSTGNVQGVVGCFIHVRLPPLSDLPRSGNVSGVVFTDEGGTLLGHTVFTGSVTESSPWSYIGVGQASPYSPQTDGLRGFDIALQMESIMGRFRRFRLGFYLVSLGLVGLGTLFQLGNPIA